MKQAFVVLFALCTISGVSTADSGMPILASEYPLTATVLRTGNTEILTSREYESGNISHVQNIIFIAEGTVDPVKKHHKAKHGSAQLRCDPRQYAGGITDIPEDCSNHINLGNKLNQNPIRRGRAAASGNAPTRKNM